MDDCAVRVLLVDDDSEEYLIIRDLLQTIPGETFALEWVADYEAALEAMVGHRHAVYLLDYRLGPRNGLDLLREAIGNGCRAPLILLTGQGDHEVDRAAMRAGAADYLVKGQFDGTLLERCLRYAIERKHAEEGLRKAHAELEDRVRERTAELATANEVLRHSEERFRTIVEGTRALLFTADARGHLTYVNAAAACALGYAPSELVGRFYLYFVHREDRRRIHHLYRQQLEHSAPNTYAEFRYVAKAGKTGWFSFLVNPVFDHGQLTGLTGVAQDITDRKQAEERIRASLTEKEVMLKEIHHRVKNNLQLVTSLLRLQSESITDDRLLAAFRECQNRIKSMTRIHELLYRSPDLARIDFAEYVEGLTSDLLRAYGADADRIRLKTRIDPVNLSINAAIPCGLLINELVSNSLEHAFPARRNASWLTLSGKHVNVGRPDHDGDAAESVPPAEIRLELRAGEGNDLVLTVADNGVGFPPNVDYRNPDTLGLQLVSTLTEQLGGKLELRRNGWTEFAIRFDS